MTRNADTEPAREDHLAEARWHLARAQAEGDPRAAAVPLLQSWAQCHALVSIAESLRLGELRRVVEGPVFAMLGEGERADILAEVREMLRSPE